MPSDPPRSAAPRPLVVEFVGIPGAGKTTTADHLVERLIADGIDADTVIGLARRRAAATAPGKMAATVLPERAERGALWWSFYGMGLGRGAAGLARRPGLARLVATAPRSGERRWRTRGHILWWYLHLIGRNGLLADGATRAQAVVVDDGFVHRSIHLHASPTGPPDPERVRAYLQRIPVPDVVVRVDADPAICRRRVEDRGVWAHSRHLAADELERYLEGAGAVAAIAAEAMAERGAEVITVPGSGDPAAIAAELAEAIVPSTPDRADLNAPGRIGRVPRLPRRSRITSAVAARVNEASVDDDTMAAVRHAFDLPSGGSARNIWLSRRNRNMVVATDDGPKVVKLYRPQWTSATVECAHSILRRLEELDVPAPRLLRTADGADQIETEQGVAAVFHFIEGANLSLYYLLRPDRLDLTVEAGTTLAGLHLALRDFVPRGEHHLGFAGHEGPRRRDLRWFGETIESLVGWSAELTDPVEIEAAGPLVAQADELHRSIEQLDQKLGDELPRLVIHGDYGLHNLLFRPRHPAVPVDFELSRLDWRAFDLISALGKHRFKDGRYDFDSMDAFQRGYTAHFPLTDAERDLFPDAWRLYKLHSAVQYWLGFFTTGGPVRKLRSALDAIDQAEWVLGHEQVLADLARRGARR